MFGAAYRDSGDYELYSYGMCSENLAMEWVVTDFGKLIRNFKFEKMKDPPSKFKATNVTFFIYVNFWLKVSPRIPKGSPGYVE